MIWRNTDFRLDSRLKVVSGLVTHVQRRGAPGVDSFIGPSIMPDLQSLLWERGLRFPYMGRIGWGLSIYIRYRTGCE